MTAVLLPDAGPRRYWEVKHQPHKKNAPVRIELRERTNRNSKRVVDSFSKLISYEDTTASAEALNEAAEKVLERAARVDDFVGIHITNDESEAA